MKRTWLVLAISVVATCGLIGVGTSALMQPASTTVTVTVPGDTDATPSTTTTSAPSSTTTTTIAPAPAPVTTVPPAPIVYAQPGPEPQGPSTVTPVTTCTVSYLTVGFDSATNTVTTAPTVFGGSCTEAAGIAAAHPDAVVSQETDPVTS